MPALVEKIVDPDNGAGTDYLSLNAFEAALPANLVTADQIWRANCRCSAGSADTTAVTFSGTVTDATRYVEVVGDWQYGTWNNNYYHLNVANAIYFEQAGYIKFYNLQIDAGTGVSIGHANPIYVNKVITISNCYLKGKCYINRSSGTTTLINTIIEQTSGVGLDVFNTITYAYNLTIVAPTGITNQYKAVTITNVIIDATTPITLSNGGTMAGNYNLSTVYDADLPGANSINGVSVTFTNAAGGDFSLTSGSRGIDEGTDLSGDGVTTDIKGVSRPQGSAYDMGAFEFVPAAINNTSDILKKFNWFGWK